MITKNRFYRSTLAILACGLTAYAARANAAQLFVDDDHAQCVDAQYSSIQAAVTAAKPGDTVNVCSGTYHEQVVIDKKLTVQGYETTNQNQAIVMPSPAVANTDSLVSHNPIAAIILVKDADGVNLSNLTVDGATNGIGGCAPNLIGVFYRNASGMADSLAVRNIQLDGSLGGCQSGLGIFVQSGGTGKSKVTLSNNSVHDYQKNGITANELGTTVTVKGNNVAGLGSTPAIAQNGIQLGFGAAGTVDKNFVLNHVYANCDANSCGAVSTNILINESDSVKVTNNTVGNSQVNIYYVGSKGEVSGNTIFQTRVFDGIALEGDSNKANNNSIFNSDESAIYISGDKNEANGNTINEAPVGVLSEASTTNSKVMGNKFFNTALESDTLPPAPITTMALSVNASGGAKGNPAAARP